MASTDIAIIGMAGRFPGARNVGEFWRNLRDGIESVKFLTPDDLTETTDDPRHVKARAMMEDVELFDASFFGYSPAEAKIMDPQQRIFLESAWEALEDAGYDSERFNGAISVYGGATTSTYLLINIMSNPSFARAEDPLQLHVGNAGDFLTTRVSYKLNLHGPSHMVESACSTSLVAVHLACQSLINEESDMALAGGISVNVRLRNGYHYSEGLESPDGHCRAFDEKAQGTLFGCGVGVVVLKRLADALADRDTIHAIIKGSAINNDGAFKVGFTAPSVEGQAEVIVEALGNAGVSAESISYIETHGTGTPLGDPIEIQALTKAFRGETERSGFCAIGSVKTNVGHLEAAAGVTSLIKTVLSLKHGYIPPSLHFTRPNPHIDFATTPFYVNTKLSPWERHGTPRRAGVSSFGFGGTNAHIVLEEAPLVKTVNPERSWQLLPITARTPVALEAATRNLATHLKENPNLSLADVAYTLQVGRRNFNQRRFVVCRDYEEGLLEDQETLALATRKQETKEQPVIFMFTGQGAQYINMGKGLYDTEPAFRKELDRCAMILKSHLDLDLREILYPANDQEEEAANRLNQTELTQPALFVFEYALAKLWLSWGVTPQAMIGHSIGEYVAACLAGVFSLEDALALVTMRGRLMAGVLRGSMLAVSVSEEEISVLLGETLSLAAVNGPTQCVVSGPTAEILALQAQLKQKELDCRLLATSHAFHSSMMEPILVQFTRAVTVVARQTPKIPFISNLTGTWITGAQATDPAYWAAHLRQTVRFASGLATLKKETPGVFLEVGPGQTLSRLAKKQGEPSASVVSSLSGPRNPSEEIRELLTAVGKLWLAGAVIDWPALHEHDQPRRISLPTYPFERQRYWIDAGHWEHLAEVTGKKPDPADWIYQSSWKRMTQIDSASELPFYSYTWIVFSDHAGMGADIVGRLRQQNKKVIRVLPAEKFTALNDDLYTINPQRAEDYLKLLNVIESQQSNATFSGEAKVRLHIIHTWNTSGLPEEIHHKTQDKGFYSLLYLAQALGKQEGRVHIDVVTAGLHDVLGNEDPDPHTTTLLAPVKIINQEFPGISCRNIDFQARPVSEEILDQLCAEIEREPTDNIIAYRGKYRWIEVFEPVHAKKSATALTLLRQEGVYLLIGGLGNSGLIFAEYLAQTVRAKLIFVNRSPLPARDGWDDWLARHGETDKISRKIRKLRGIEAHGAEILLLNADVADQEAMSDVIARIYAQFGILHGVIYATGMPGTENLCSLQETDRALVEKHFQTKVDGLLVLANVLAGKKLDFCLLNSSLTTILGGFGTIAYTAAHLFMDAFAKRQNQTSGTYWLSVDWDAWLTGGEEDHNKHLETIVTLAITPGEVKEIFPRLFHLKPTSQVIISTGNLGERITKMYVPGGSITNPEEVMEEDRVERPDVTSTYVAPRNDYERNVTEIWQQMLGIARIGIYDDFFELGGHSMLVTQLLNKLHRIYPIELSIRTLFTNPTIAGMATLIEEAMILKAGQAEEPILELLRKSTPSKGKSLLDDYWRKRIATALNIAIEALPGDGSLAGFDLKVIGPEIIWNFQQDFRLQVYPHEIPRMQDINTLIDFTLAERERLRRFKQITQTQPESRYDEYDTQARQELKPTRMPLNLAKKNKKMVFLHSSPRAGSTLLRIMLAGHPVLFSPPELDILTYDTMGEWSRSLNDTNFGHGFDWTTQGLLVTLMELRDMSKEAAQIYLDELIAEDTPMHQIYARLVELAEPRLLIDKSPSYSMDLPTLRRAEEIFADARYIFLIRHPYAVIESFLRIRLDKLFGPAIYGHHDVDPHVIAEKIWYTCNHNMVEFLKDIPPERKFIIRYEDMVKEPRLNMEALCSFLDIPFDEALLQPYDDKRERLIINVGGDPNILQHDKVDPHLGETWRTLRMPWQFSRQTRALATEFGYELPGMMLKDPGSLTPINISEEDGLQKTLELIETLSIEEVHALLESMK